MDTYVVPEQSQQQCRQQDDFQPEKAMEKVAGKGPCALFGSAESTRTYQEPAEHEEDDDRRMAETSVAIGQDLMPPANYPDKLFPIRSGGMPEEPGGGSRSGFSESCPSFRSCFYTSLPRYER